MADEQLPEGTDTIIEGAGGSSEKSWAGEAVGGGSSSAGGNGAWFDKIESLKSQSYDSARAYAVSGKDKATTALDDLIRMVGEAAGQIDEKVGSNYGDYARKAADGLGSFNEGLKGKDVDELFADARAMVAKAPAVAVGTAAALGFIIARLARAGLPETTPPADDKPKD